MINRIVIKKKTGEEMFLGMDHSLLDFWSWAHSDMISNQEEADILVLYWFYFSKEPKIKINISDKNGEYKDVANPKFKQITQSVVEPE